jgi:hypothetical protein
VEAASLLLPSEYRSPDLVWSELSAERADCGTDYLWRHLMRHLVGARRLDSARELAADGAWMRAKVLHFGQPGPALDDLRRAGTAESDLWAKLSRVAHLLRAEDGPDTIDAILTTRVGIVLAGRSSADPGNPARLTLLSCDDGEPGGVVRVLDGHRGPVAACSVSVDGSRALTVGEDGSIRFWDLTTGEILAAGHPSEVPFTDCALLRDGRRAVTVRDDGRAQLWDTRDLSLPLDELTGAPPDGFRSCTAVNEAVVACCGRADWSLYLLSIAGPGRQRSASAPGTRSYLRLTAHLQHREQVWDALARPTDEPCSR